MPKHTRVLAATAIAWAAACGDAADDATGPAPVPNRAPLAVGAIPDQTVAAGEMASVEVSSYFNDPDGDALSYTAASSDDAVAAASVSGASVTVAARAKGVVAVTVAARDPQGLMAEQRFQVTVPNRAPEAADEIPSQTVFAGQTVSVDASTYFSDPDGDALTYEAMSSDEEVATATVAADTVTIRAVTTGVAAVTIRASDPDGEAAERTVRVTVPNRAPEALGEIPAQTVPVAETAAVDLSPYFSDPDGDSLTYTASSSNERVAGAAVSDSSVTLTALAPGVAVVTVTARDPRGLAAQQSFTVTVPNRAPYVENEIPDQTVTAGETVTLDASLHFKDPDGDALTYAAVSSDAGVAEVSVSGSSVAVTGVARGVAVVTVTARDPQGLSADSTFRAIISRPGFQIDLVFASPVSPTQEATFVRAAERWMAALAPTDLPGIARRGRPLTCGDDARFERDVDLVDDLMIVAAVDEIDGPSGTLGFAGPCWIRSSSLLPFYGRMVFDEADLERLERDGNMEDVILHEMGHVLGIGTLWEYFDLLRDPSSEDVVLDTHFTGPLAIEAFDEAGGANYAGAKVPVENTGGAGTRNGHWRSAILQTELMIGYSTPGPESLSAITVQSLADLGYLVDPAAADPYRLPAADAARRIDPERLIPYGDDIWRGPIVVADPAGRVIRVIPGARGGDLRQ